MFEDDYNFLKRIKEYSNRLWKEPLLCTYLWDKYDVTTQLLNRNRLICRCDTDYAYDDDYNLRIINRFNTLAPFFNQLIRISAYAYNEYGELEEGNLVLYANSGGDQYYLIGELPYIDYLYEDICVITKYYPPNVEQWAESITLDDINISEPTCLHVRSYLEADYFVSEDGNDANPGTFEEPFKSLQHAMAEVCSGGTVCILTSLTNTTTVLCWKDCNIIGENIILSAENGVFLTIAPMTHVYLQGITCKSWGVTIQTYTDDYIYNNKNTILSIETKPIKAPPSYTITITTDLYWVSGEQVHISITGNIPTSKTVYVFNSLNELISENIREFTYLVPYGLEYDTIRLFVLEDNYMYSETFEVYDIISDWYVDTLHGSNNNSGKSLQDAFQTLDYALTKVTKLMNHIFFMGEELIDNYQISTKTYIRGLKNKSVLYSESDDYFTVYSSLIISDLFLTNMMVTSNTYINNATAPLTIRLPEIVLPVIYVDGTNGNDSNTGDSWTHALQTLQKALTKGADMIYFSGTNSISTPLHIGEIVEIEGVMNTNQITYIGVGFFNIDPGKVLILKNITLVNPIERGTITDNTYFNIGTAKLEVIL